MKNIAELLHKHGIGNDVTIHTTLPADVRGELLFHSETLCVLYVTDGFSDNIPRLFIIPEMGRNIIEAMLNILAPSGSAKRFVSELKEKSPLEILMEALVGKMIFPELAPFEKLHYGEIPEVINDGREYQIFQFDVDRTVAEDKRKIDRFVIVPKDKTKIGFNVVTRTNPDNSEANKLREILTEIRV